MDSGIKDVRASIFIDRMLFLGEVSQVRGGSVTLSLSHSPESNDDKQTARDSVGWGDYVIIVLGEVSCFGRVAELRGTTAELENGAQTQIVDEALVQLWSTVDLTVGTLQPGIKLHPKIGAPAYLATREILSVLAEEKAQHGGTKDVLFDVARLSDAYDLPIQFSPESLFGRHCAVVGSSGSGKSWTLARMVEQAARFQSKVVLIDATGEYDSLGNMAAHAYLGPHPDPPKRSIEASYPYYELAESDLFAIFQPTGEGQAPKLRSAVRTLKLAYADPSIALDGVVVKAHREKAPLLESEARFYDRIEEPGAYFDVSRLTEQIKHECVNSFRSSTETNLWGGPNTTDESRCIPLMNRISDILLSTSLAAIFYPDDKPSIINVLDSFFQSDEARVLVVSMQYLSYAHHAREIIANCIGRHLLEIARKGRFTEEPLLLFVDEAHNFLKESLENETHGYPLDSYALIAKEARKYSFSICLATQRPRDIPESVLSQMGTVIVHRLANSQDREIIERSVSSMDDSSLDSLPALRPGEGVLTGSDFAIPLRIAVEAPEHKPRSRGPNFQKYWTNTRKQGGHKQ